MYSKKKIIQMSPMTYKVLWTISFFTFTPSAYLQYRFYISREENYNLKNPKKRLIPKPLNHTAENFLVNQY